MPLYDCMFLFKPHVSKEAIMDLMAKVGKHAYRRNGVVTHVKSFETVQLGYGIKKLDGRHYQGQLMQMTLMTSPSFNNELHYLNKEDRLLRWLLVKHRDFKFGSDIWNEGGLLRQDIRSGQEDPAQGDYRNYEIKLEEPGASGFFFNKRSSDDDEDDDEDDYEYQGDEKDP